MHEDHDRLAARIAAKAMDKPVESRPGYLDSACGRDEALRGKVEALLIADVEAGSFLERPVLRVAEGAPAAPDPLIGARIDGFQVLRRLAVGGMGAVYEAQQENPRRRVALKVIRAGAATPAALRRFEHEAHVLARLQHPGIAQIFEAGSFDRGVGPQPFFAMELIDGRALTSHAEGGNLGTRERLGLFTRVCDAVHYAHQRGVIHRDLKPGNVLVTESGQPKILDFGVARVTDADVQTTTLHTHAGELIGTLPYMSPEQVQGDADQIDVRSDIYALGVMLYEVLSGRLPQDLRDKAIPEAARMIQDEEITPLSSVARVFRGDLDTIVATALAKDPQRRYQSAAELAADVRRYLDDEPITARPASAMYQLRKFARRNKGIVVSFAAVMLILVACGTVAALFGVREASARRTAEDRLTLLTKSEERARKEALKADQIAKFLQSMLDHVDPVIAQGADTVLLRQVLDDASKRIDVELGQYPEVEASIQGTIGNVYRELDQYDLAEVHLKRAFELNRSHLGEEHRDTLDALDGMAYLLQERGSNAEAETMLVGGLEVSQRILGEEDPITFQLMDTLGMVLFNLGRVEEAAALHDKELAIATRLWGEESSRWQRAAHHLGRAYRGVGRLDDAEMLLEKVLEVRQRQLGRQHPLTLMSLEAVGGLYWSQERYDQAAAAQAEVLEGRRRVFGERNTSTLTSMYNLAAQYYAMGLYDKAEPLYAKVLEVRREVLGNEHIFTLSAMTSLGLTLSKQRRYEEAAMLFAENLALRERVQGDRHPDTLRARTHLAVQYRELGRTDEAQTKMLDALDVQRRTLGEEHRVVLYTLESIAILYGSQGLFERAAEIYEDVLEVRRRTLGVDARDTLVTMAGLATQYENLDRLDQSEQLAAQAWAGLRRKFGEEHPDSLAAGRTLARLRNRQKRYEEAEAMLVAILDGTRRRAEECGEPLASTRYLLGLAIAGQGRDEEAEPLLAAAEDSAREREPQGQWRLATYLRDHGATLSRLGRFEEAEPRLLESQRILEATFGPANRRTQGVITLLVELYEAWGRPEQAEQCQALLPTNQGALGRD